MRYLVKIKVDQPEVHDGLHIDLIAVPAIGHYIELEMNYYRRVEMVVHTPYRTSVDPDGKHLRDYDAIVYLGGKISRDEFEAQFSDQPGTLRIEPLPKILRDHRG